jgi:pyruvate dehydrogenase (quinone)
MTQTTSDFLVEPLQAWGVRRIYGYPGDGINGILGALDRAGDRDGRVVPARSKFLSGKTY